ncbi:hypothetical protein [uncultured Alsobacter sp.]|uniref:hypothetical protein n=1 Tax=uncultured Alsobacter sp. TaxID=1748258 RepID=UPI0025E398ED|nr:hypothetical protein [uncultured Alsobacter sp.]
MTALPANNFVNDGGRTSGEMKTALNDIVKFLRERGGAGAGWVGLAGGGTVDLGAQTGRMYSLTGGPSVTSLGTTAPGDSFPFLIKVAARTTFTRGANLQIQGLANNGDVLVLEIDDIIGAVWEGSNVWRVYVVSRASGQGATSPSGLRNRVINGDFRIDQRNAGASITITAGAALLYGLDRWYLACTGANATAQQAISGGKARLLISGASGVTGATVGQRIERQNSDDLANGRASLSVDIQAVGSLTTVNYAVYHANTNDAFGTIASPTRTLIASGPFTVSTTEARYTVPNISIPSGATTGIEIVFSTGALGSGNGFYLGNVQLEAGSFCTPFDRRPHGAELALCQRYYEKSFDQNVKPAQATGIYSGAITTLVAGSAFVGNALLTNRFKVEKRATPTITAFNPRSGGTSNCMTDSAGTDTGATLNVAGTSGFMFYNSGGALNANAYAYVHFTADAEL